MNLFENLQLLRESENKIISEFKEFLAAKNAQYIYNELGETKDGMQIVIYDGDWKHEHLYMKRLLDEFFTNKGIDISITSEEIGESDQDTYSARYNVTFNAEPKEYTADVKSLKFTTEDTNKSDEIKYQVTCQMATSNDDVYSEHSTLKDAIDSARKAQQSFTNVKIKDLSDGSSWSDIDNAEQDLKDGIIIESNNSEWKYIKKTIAKDEIFGDITEGDYYIKRYKGDIIAYIYPPSESNKYYKAKLSSNSKIDPSGYYEFASLELAKKYLDDVAIKLAPVTYEEIKQQLEEIDTHEFLVIDIDHSLVLNNTKVTIIGTLINGEEIIFYDSSYLRTQRDVDFIKDQYAKASKEIDHMRKTGYLGVKDESIIEITEVNNENYDDNAATFLDKIEKEITTATHKFMMAKGFPEDEVKDYSRVSTDITDDYVKVSVGAELEYDSLFELCKTLDKIIEKEDKDAYFEPECPGRIVAYLFGEKVKKVHKEKEQALKDKVKSIDKIEETNHNEVLDRDYATGEKIYNELVEYLNSLDQISMDGEDCNWQPSEFNAKNLNADGEIYLESGAYILIYPYINEWAEDYFRVIVVEASDLQPQIKSGIESVYNKIKTDNWKLIFEG